MQDQSKGRCTLRNIIPRKMWRITLSVTRELYGDWLPLLDISACKSAYSSSFDFGYPVCCLWSRCEDNSSYTHQASTGASVRMTWLNVCTAEERPSWMEARASSCSTLRTWSYPTSRRADAIFFQSRSE
jgi:hypothetical protein